MQNKEEMQKEKWQKVRVQSHKQSKKWKTGIADYEKYFNWQEFAFLPTCARLTNQTGMAGVQGEEGYWTIFWSRMAWLNLWLRKPLDLIEVG